MDHKDIIRQTINTVIRSEGGEAADANSLLQQVLQSKMEAKIAASTGKAKVEADTTDNQE